MASTWPKVGKAKSPVGWRFDGRNPDAVAFAERAAARYVTRVSSETREALQSIIVRAIQDGISARDTAELIRSTVGLTTQGSAAVKNYYGALLERGEDPARAWELADKYSDKLLKSRAQTIARTEIMGALNAGSLEQARQRAEAGVFKKPMKKWMITQDEVTCPKCRPMEGQKRQLMTPFSNGVMVPPAHPNCRCAPTYYDDAFGGAPTPNLAPRPTDVQQPTGAERIALARKIRENREKKSR